MQEPRKIVLILGNGFDLDLGLKTSYKDFWESEFCKCNCFPAPIINHLNQRWIDNREGVKWYDLENELMNYYKGLKEPQKGEDIFTKEEKELLADFSTYNYGCGFYYDRIETINSLIEKGALIAHKNQFGQYLVEERYDKKDCIKPAIERDKMALELIKRELCDYLKSIKRPEDNNDSTAAHVLSAMIRTAKAGDFVDIFSFNYTPIIYRGFHRFDVPVHYMHGNCESGSIIIGTRDDIEIVPEYSFLQKAMNGSFAPPDIVTPLKEADEIIIFGHSLGDNDRQYFAPFFKRQSDEVNPVKKDIVLFTRDESSQIELKRSMQKMTDGHLSSLYSINQPVIIKTAELATDLNNQKIYKSFLIKHGFSEDYSERSIGKLLQKTRK